MLLSLDKMQSNALKRHKHLLTPTALPIENIIVMMTILGHSIRAMRGLRKSGIAERLHSKRSGIVRKRHFKASERFLTSERLLNRYFAVYTG